MANGVYRRGLTRRDFLKVSGGAGAGLALLGSAGCGGGGSAESGAITVWGWDIAADALRDVIPRFNERYPDIEVTVEDQGRLDQYDKLTSGLAAGGSGLPDVFMVETDRLPGYTGQFADGMANLSELGADKYRDRIAQSKWPQATRDGQIYAMPWDIGPTGVFYRTDFFEQGGANPDEIETWDQLVEAGSRILEATDVQLVAVDAANDDGLFRSMLNQQGSYYFNEAGQITINSDEAVRAMEAIKAMNDAGILLNAEGYDGGAAAFANERVAAAVAGVWYTGTITGQAPDQSGEWDVFLMPAFESGGNRAANLGGSNLALSANGQNVEAAYKFAEFAMTNARAQTQMMKDYGLFPSLTETYDEPFFEEPVEYFSNEPIYDTFADEVENIPEAYYTEDYARALERSVDAQARVLLDGGDPRSSLDQAAEQLAQDTDREIA